MRAQHGARLPRVPRVPKVIPTLAPRIDTFAPTGGIWYMRDSIFISYRRDDARGASGRLYDWLRIAFGREPVFRDVHSIGAGRWREKIDVALARSAVCVAVVGRRWADAENLPRLHTDSDMVRHELLSALAATDDGLVLIPTLVEDTAQPPTAGLPDCLLPLFEWNSFTISESGWEDDTRRLLAEIAKLPCFQVRADVDQLLETAAAAGEQLAALERERRLQADQIAALRVTVDDLTRQLAEARTAEDRATTAEALSALARGDTLAAEDAFERESERQDRAEQSARLAKAEALRNVANLANLRNVRKAVEFYRKALKAQPEHAETARALGLALIDLGKLAEAEHAFRSAIDMARTQGDGWMEMAASNGIGDVLVAQGDLAGALQASRQHGHRRDPRRARPRQRRLAARSLGQPRKDRQRGYFCPSPEIAQWGCKPKPDFFPRMADPLSPPPGEGLTQLACSFRLVRVQVGGGGRQRRVAKVVADGGEVDPALKRMCGMRVPRPVRACSA